MIIIKINQNKEDKTLNSANRTHSRDMIGGRVGNSTRGHFTYPKLSPFSHQEDTVSSTDTTYHHDGKGRVCKILNNSAKDLS